MKNNKANNSSITTFDAEISCSPKKDWGNVTTRRYARFRQQHLQPASQPLLPQLRERKLRNEA